MNIKTYVYEYRTDRSERHELVESAVREYMGNDSAEVLYTPKGKPYVKDSETVFLSVTTTGEVMVVAISDKPIGIDGEYLPRMTAPQRRTDYAVMAERFFTEDEAEYVRSGDDQALRFAKVWVRKEAYVKYTGKGLSDFSNFSVYGGEHFVQTVNGVPVKRWHPSFPMSEDYLFAVAGETE